MKSEFAHIDWIRRSVAAHTRVPIGIGDDAASIQLADRRACLITTDMLLEGVHFTSDAAPLRVGRKAMNVNLSDIAAMAGRPIAAVVAVAFPSHWSDDAAEQLQRGLHDAAQAFDVAIVGGDTNRSPNGLVVAVTVLGETTERGAVCRSGARSGDWIVVTGPLGGSLLGHHLDFTPRVREALHIHRRFDVHAMIDVSDGLAADLGHVARESNRGARLFAAQVPVSSAAQQRSDGVSPLDHALHDGEDFELILTLDPADANRLLAEGTPGADLRHIGVICDEPGLTIEYSDGRIAALEPRGYDHFAPINRSGPSQ